MVELVVIRADESRLVARGMLRSIDIHESFQCYTAQVTLNYGDANSSSTMVPILHASFESTIYDDVKEHGMSPVPALWIRSARALHGMNGTMR